MTYLGFPAPWWIQLISSILATVLITYQVGMSRKQRSSVLFFSWILTGVFVLLPILYKDSSHATLIPYLPLIAFALVASFEKESIFPKVHEGEVLLVFFTYLYVVFQFNPETRNVFLYVSAIPAAFLIFELISTRQLRPSSRFMLAALFSLACGLLAFHQISFLADFRSIETNAEGRSLPWLAIQCLLTSMTATWGAAHLFRLIRLLPGKHEIRYLHRLRTETIPEFIMQVSPHNLSIPIIGIAACLHAFPLALNHHYEFTTPQVAVAYAMLLSPILVHKVCLRLQHLSRPIDSQQKDRKTG